MKFFTVLVCTLLFAVKANANDVNALTCNACNENQKTQRAISARQENGLSHQYVFDLVSGTLTKYKVYLESSCCPTKPSTKDLTNHTAERCGRNWIADAEVVEPELARKGEALSIIFLHFGNLEAKVDIDVAELAASDPAIAGMDAFDYTNNSSYRNILHEMIRDRLSNHVGDTIAGALEDLFDTADRLLADGKAGKFYIRIKFADGSEVTRQVIDSHTSVVHVAPQDANYNDIPGTAGEAVGRTFMFRHNPEDYSDWVNYMRSRGVRVTDGSGGGRMSCSSDIVDGVTVVRCIAI